MDFEHITREALIERCLAQEDYIKSVDAFFAARIHEAGDDGAITIEDDDLAPVAAAKLKCNERLEAIQ